MNTALTLQDILRMFAETDARFKQTDERYKQTDAQIKEQFAETAAQIRDTEKMIKGLSKQLGHFGNRLGEFVEEMVRPAVVRLLQDRGIDVSAVMRNYLCKRGDESFEIDLLVINHSEAVAVECKSELLVEAVQYHIKRLIKFKQMDHHYRDMKLYGGVAGMVLHDDAVDFANKNGLFVLGPSGDTMTLCNPSDFQPKTW